MQIGGLCFFILLTQSAAKPFFTKGDFHEIFLRPPSFSRGYSELRHHSTAYRNLFRRPGLQRLGNRKRHREHSLRRPILATLGKGREVRKDLLRRRTIFPAWLSRWLAVPRQPEVREKRVRGSESAERRRTPVPVERRLLLPRRQLHRRSLLALTQCSYKRGWTPFG
jgi:hypothetical protein